MRMTYFRHLRGVFILVLFACIAIASAQNNFQLNGGESIHLGSPGWASADGSFSLLVRPDGTVGIDWVTCGNVPVWTLSQPDTLNQVRYAKAPFVLDASFSFTFQKKSGSGGDLFLYNSSGIPIWSTETGGQGVRAELTATGNFQLLDAVGAAVWNSFDFPTDTLLPSQQLTNAGGKFAGLAAGQFRLFLQADGTLVLYRAGEPCRGGNNTSSLCNIGLYQYCSFNSDSWVCGQQEAPSGGGATLSAELVYSSGEIKLTTGTPGSGTELLVVGNGPLPNIKTPMRLTLGTDGQLRLFQWQVPKKDAPSWEVLSSVVQDLCVAGPCGSYSGCSMGTSGTYNCSCMRGFQPNPAGMGCVPWTPLACGVTNKFIDIQGFTFLDGDVDISIIANSPSPKACKDECMRNAQCECVAISYSAMGECRLKYALGPANYDASGQSVGLNYSVRITDLPPRPPPSPPPPMPIIHAAGPSVGAIVGGVLGGVFGALFFAFFVYCFLRRRDGYRKGIKQGPKEEDYFAPGPGAAIFTYEMLKDCTNGFSDSNRLGHGGFGLVFKGTIRNGTTVAIKALSEKSRQGDNEFMAEANLLSRLQHPNLVRLQGWCSSGQRRLLVYEYMSGGSLDKLLFSVDKPPLTFAARWHIIRDVAKALAYMHEGWERVVVHRDVKTSNILLDSRMHARLGDFGLARSGGKDKDYISTEYAAGTAGYAPPESQYGSQASPKWDVFSFGVVVLEMASGRRAVDTTRPTSETSLRLYAWQMHREGRLMDLPDPRMQNKFPHDRMVQLLSMGLLCTAIDPKERPTMTAVVNKFMAEKTVEPIKLPAEAPPPPGQPYRDQTSKSLHGIIKGSTPLGTSHSSPGKLVSVGSQQAATPRRSGQQNPVVPPSPPRPYFVQSPSPSHFQQSPSQQSYGQPSPQHHSQASSRNHSPSPQRLSPPPHDTRVVYISNVSNGV